MFKNETTLLKPLSLSLSVTPQLEMKNSSFQQEKTLENENYLFWTKLN